MELLNTVLALVFVLALAGAFIWLLKRWQTRAQGGNATSASELRFVRALVIGRNERVVVLQYAGEELLVGVSPGGMSLLTKRSITAPNEQAPGPEANKN